MGRRLRVEAEPMANIENLKQLRRVVEAVPEGQFDMEWFGKKTDCGTVCCAAGWAALDPWFQANTPINQALPIDTRPVRERRDRDQDEVFNIDAMFDGDAPIEKLARIFDLSDQDANNLFNGPTIEGVPKSDVIDNIDRLIRGESAFCYVAEDEE
jgi:hypothetical protein